MLYAVAHLAIKGLPLGAGKCVWLAHQVTILGVELSRDDYCIGKKALGKLVTGGLPHTIVQL